MKNYIILILPVFMTVQMGCSNSSSSAPNEIIIFHAGSLSVPFRELAREYERRNKEVKILLEPAGSLVCARKITELKKPCDIVASSDYFVIDKFLIPDYARWSIRFTTNEIVIAFQEKSKYASEIDSSNWKEILLKEDVTFARSDPDSDPCGYRTVIAFLLADNYYGMPALSGKLLSKNREFIRPKEVDLVALIEANAADYMFQYKSVAIQHNLKYIELPDELNLGNPEMDKIYNTVSVDVAASSPGSTMTIRGDYINYSLTVLSGAPNKQGAVDFVSFLLSMDGQDILRRNGHDPLIPYRTDQPEEIPTGLSKFFSDNN